MWEGIDCFTYQHLYINRFHKNRMQSYCLVPGAASTEQVFIMAFQNTPFVRVQPNLDNQTSEMPESRDAKQLV